MKITSLIQKAFVATALACLVAPSAQAQQLNRTLNLQKESLMQKASFAKKSNIPSGARFITINPSDYGTVEVVMEEDFSKFATGSEDAPDFDADDIILDFGAGECEYPWWNVNPDYTTLPQWGGANLFPAGGKVFMLESINDGQGHINTPLLDFTKFDGGVAFIEFKARTSNPKLAQRLSIEAAETNHMGPDWTVLGAEITDPLTEDWKTYTVMYYGAGETTLFNIVPQMEQWWYETKSEEPCKVLFDDFKVYSLNQFVEIPKGLSHKNYTGSEFDLTWNKEDADKYLVDVFTVDMETGEREDFITGQEVSTNEMHVTGAVSGVTYFFTVTACKGDKKSFPSLPEMVFDMEDPTFTGVPTIEENNGNYSYTSEWSDVPSAEVYDYWAMPKRVAKADGEFTIFESDFEGLLDAEGNTTEYTPEEPAYSCYGMLALKGDCMKQAGWVGKSFMPFSNCVCLDGWQHIVAGADAYIVSPELDLSKDGGNIKVTAKFLGRIGGYFDPIAQEQHDNLQTKAAVSLYNYNEETGQFEQAYYYPVEDVTTAWNTFDIDLEGGSKRSYIVISAIEGPEQLYIDDVKIKQNYKAGEGLVEPFLYEMFYYDPAIDVEIPEMCKGEEISEKVLAIKTNPKTQAPLYSKAASQVIGFAGEDTGIDNISIADAPLTYENGHVVVNNADGEIVNVYTVDGKLVSSSRDSHIVLNLNKGVYMVNVAGKTIKVSL